MKIVFSADHAGFELKEKLVPFVREELGYEVEDVGAHTNDPEDDYPVFVRQAAERVSANPQEVRGVVLGGSGQGEAMVANRFPGVRAAVYYGQSPSEQVDASGNTLDIIRSSREHNDANVLALGARFLTESQAREAVKMWLETSFNEDERHVRRIKQIDEK